MDNAGDTEPCGKCTCQVCDHKVRINIFTTKACGKVLIFQCGPLNCNSKKVIYLLTCKICDELPMLKSLKQSPIFILITIKVNTNLLEKGSKMCHRSVFLHTMSKIATKVLMLRKSLYLRIVKCIDKLKGNFLATQIEKTLRTQS